MPMRRWRWTPPRRRWRSPRERPSPFACAPTSPPSPSSCRACVTDGDGRAEVPVTLPDNLTRYRVMVVAAEGGQRFGSGEATLLARLPLMVRPSPPRFLNFGDRFELPVVVQNQTDEEMTVDVAVRAGNAELLEGDGRRLVGAPRTTGPRCASPPPPCGRAPRCFQVGAVSGPLADAAELTLPVWTPATTEAFATYGQIDEGAVAQPVQAPAGVVPDFGGLEVTTSSTALQALTDAVLYLVAYPFECAEQLSSRILAVAALRDVLAAFEAEGLPAPDEMQEAVGRDIEQLRGLQNGDGGFGFWRRGDRSWPFVSIHAAHALVRAQQKGFPVPEGVARALGRLPRGDRRAHPRGLPRCRPGHPRGLRPPCPGPHGPPPPGAGPGPRRREAGDDAVLRGPGLDPPDVVPGPRGAGGAGEGPAASRQRRHRDGRGRALRRVLQRRRAPPSPLRSAGGRGGARGPGDRPASQRPHTEASGRPPRAPEGGTVVEHPGERLRPPRPGSVLPGLREDDPGLRGPGLAGRSVRRRARLPRSHHREPRRARFPWAR